MKIDLLKKIELLKPNDDFLEDWGHDIWVMDNHKWAFYVWEAYSIDSGYDSGISLIHIDYHFDHNDRIAEGSEAFTTVASRDKDKIFHLIKNSEGRITYDSFIAPFVRLGRLNNIYWLCRQTDEDIGFSDEFLHQNCCTQSVNWKIDDLIQQHISQPYIFDFCLDYFCDNDKDMYAGPIWSSENIEKTVSKCEPMIKDAALVSVSFSFGYSGTEHHTREIAETVLPRFVEIRAAAA